MHKNDNKKLFQNILVGKLSESYFGTYEANYAVLSKRKKKKKSYAVIVIWCYAEIQTKYQFTCLDLKMVYNYHKKMLVMDKFLFVKKLR